MRNIDYKDPDDFNKPTTLGLPEGVLPGCGGSDVDVREWVAIATKDYAPGQFVEVSPGLVLPSRRFDGSLVSRFLLPLDNEFSILVMGKGAIYVGADADPESDTHDSGAPNLAADFFDNRDSYSPMFREAASGEQATILIGFKATNPISIGDQLVLSLEGSPFIVADKAEADKTGNEEL